MDDPFFITGGTLAPGALSYIERAADGALFASLLRGEFCYVLTSRQVGKSSLMIRVAEKLRGEGHRVVVVDLSAIGQNVTAAQWYRGIVSLIAQQCPDEDELLALWRSQHETPMVQRVLRFIEAVLQREPALRLTLFVDEIDGVRSLAFSCDEFFACIRAAYNQRAERPELNRFAVCLLGSAAPTDLIRDPRCTPFNLGRRIELTDFRPEEARPLAVGLAVGKLYGRPDGPEQAQRLLQRVLYLTGGHPYLTQRFCNAVAERDCVTPGEVDAVCREIYLSGGVDTDTNLVFVRSRVLGGPTGEGATEDELAGLLDLYKRVLGGQLVANRDTDPYVSILRLAGLVSAEGSHLRVRNRIYARVFDRKWIAEHLPRAELRRQQQAYRRALLRVGAVSTVLVGVVGGFAVQSVLSERRAHKAEVESRRLAGERGEALGRMGETFYGSQVHAAWQAVDQRRFDQAARLLKSLIPQSGQADFRDWAWSYLWERSHPWDRSFFDPARRAASVHFLRDGSQLAVSGARHEVTVRDLATDRVVFEYTTDHQGPWHQLTFAASGTVLASVGGPMGPNARPVELVEWQVDLVGIPDGRRIARLRPGGPVGRIALTRDGRYFAAQVGDPFKRQLRLWDARTGHPLPAPDLKGYVTALAAAANTEQFVVGTAQGEIGLLTPRLSPPFRPANHVRPPARRMAVSADGRRLAWGGADGRVTVFDLAARRPVATYPPLQGQVLEIALSGDGSRVAVAPEVPQPGANEGDLLVASVGSSRVLEPAAAHERIVTGLSFHPRDGRLSTTSLDGTARIWPVSYPTVVQPVQRFPQRLEGISELLVSRDAGRIVLRAGQRLQVWGDTPARCLRKLIVPLGDYPALSADGSCLAVGGRNPVVVYPLDTQDPPARLLPHRATTALTFLNRTRIVTGHPTGEVLMWSLPEGRVERRVVAHSHNVMRIQCSDDGRTIATSGGGNIIRSWTALLQPTGWPDVSPAADVSLAVARDGHSLAFAHQGFPYQGDLLTGRSTPLSKSLLPGRNGLTRSGVSQSPDGRIAAAAPTPGIIHFWQVATGIELGTVRLPRGLARVIAFSGNGRWLVAAGPGGITRMGVPADSHRRFDTISSVRQTE